MKIKQHIVITDVQELAAGNYYSCFNLFDHETSVSGWINVGPIEFEVDLDVTEAVEEHRKVELAKFLAKRDKIEEAIRKLDAAYDARREVEGGIKNTRTGEVTPPTTQDINEFESL